MTLSKEVEAKIAAYRPRSLTATQWAYCARQVRACVRAAEPASAGAAQMHFSALLAHLTGPAGWDKASTPDLSELLTKARIDVAARDTTWGSHSTRVQRVTTLRTLGRAVGAVPSRQRAQRPVIDLTPTGLSVRFARESSARTVEPSADSGVAAAIAAYVPRLLPDTVWSLVRPAATALVTQTAPAAVTDAKVLLSNLVAYLCDSHVWDRQDAPDLAGLLTVEQIAAHVERAQFGTRNAKAGRQKFLLSLGRVAGSVSEVRPRPQRPYPVDPFLATGATLPIPVKVLAQARQTATPASVGKLNLDYVARAIWAARATASADAASTVWDVSALVALTEVPDQPVGVNMASHAQQTSQASAPAAPGRRGTSRRAKLAAAKAARERADAIAAEATAVDNVAPALPEPSDVDEAIRVAVQAFVPKKRARPVWEANRELAQQLVYAYRPVSPRNARNIASFLAPFLTWSASTGGRDATEPLTLTGLFAPAQIEAFLDASTWADASKSGVRSVLRRIDKNLRPHAAPISLSHQKVGAPYTRTACEEFVRLAWHQPNDEQQRRLAFIIGLGLGAGLDAQDMRHLRRRHLSMHTVQGHDVLMVCVPGTGARARTVPVRTQYLPLLQRALESHDDAKLDEDAPLVAKVATTINMVSPVLRRAKSATNDQPVTVQTARLRHTWLVAVMCAPVSLADVLQAAGLSSARTLTELLEYCPPAPADGVTAALAACSTGNDHGGDAP